MWLYRRMNCAGVAIRSSSRRSAAMAYSVAKQPLRKTQLPIHFLNVKGLRSRMPHDGDIKIISVTMA